MLRLSRSIPFLLAGACLLCPAVPAAPPPKAVPAITVQATYPGANAKVVAETVAVPIEEQVHGVLDMLHMSSQSSNDGTYRLTVTFKPGTDMDIAKVLVANRVCLAQPVLPAVVNQEGLAVKKMSPGVLLMATLTSPGGTRDGIFLSQYALIQLVDELARVPGVLNVAMVGRREYAMNVQLQPDKLAARELTPMDVAEAVAAQNVPIAPQNPNQPPVKGQPISFTVSTQGRLIDPDGFGEIIVKTDGKGRIVRFRDVGTIELGVNAHESRATLNGKHAAVLCIYPTPEAKPREVSAAVTKTLDLLRRRLPEGLRLDLAFDFTSNVTAPTAATTPEYLLLDVALPANASSERYTKVLDRCDAVLRKTAGVLDVLTLSENPFDQAPSHRCVLVRLAPADKRASRQEMMQAIRAALTKEIAEMTLRLRDLSGPNRFPSCAFPVNLAVRGPDGKNEQTFAFADKLAERLRKSTKVTDVWLDPASRPVPKVEVEIDRIKAATLRVALADIDATLKIYGEGARAEDIRKLRVRNDLSQMVPLDTIVTVRTTPVPQVIHRFDRHPVLNVTANPATGVPFAEIRTLSETLAAQILSAEYRLQWLD
jgi:multidrug efflux pump subunit AcrB